MADESQKWVLMVTAQTPTNIAVIKYWGKRDEKLILPVNDSISVTLDPAHLCTTTTVSVSPTFDQDRMWLNGEVYLLVASSLSLTSFFLSVWFPGKCPQTNRSTFFVWDQRLREALSFDINNSVGLHWEP